MGTRQCETGGEEAGSTSRAFRHRAYLPDTSYKEAVLSIDLDILGVNLILYRRLYGSFHCSETEEFPSLVLRGAGRLSPSSIADRSEGELVRFLLSGPIIDFSVTPKS